ncbi:predicted protein [Uncinocarpus reesii 1704]|uniref:Peroxin/Ferlin domain-containing protein n=1 Tax=Uncinocarpus reesii (strain UAMH 1704) TaxID=336963 RepID=C4JWE1_UNCRE|nr:uncharacterized protein UREG_06883 [Uncinocarpus reesii 1704]EEP82018.1 predicted protein [Uncinocarpus reesii 1704]
MTDATTITLVDNTHPEIDSDITPILSSSFSRPPRSLAKKLTRNSVRENLARRKYAKWQQDRYDNRQNECSRESSLSRRQSSQRERTTSIGPSSTATDDAETAGLDGASTATRGEPQSEIDVLYENQRGMFFFGIPYYSEKSLLNLDPTAWLTKNFEMSPVDITNAQLPDPSWEWDWKTWYIDMSYDVDEEGWQYSFSFASRFAWHGTHPWFHSFVRRRRWLRKRVKKGTKELRRIMTEDRSQAYSTIDEFLTSRTASRTREPSICREGTSHVSTIQQDQEDVISPDEITNPVTLLKAVKRAALDREKIEAVKAFVHMGGEELAYLEETLPEILSLLLFHTSRRQLADFLLSAIEEIPEDTKDEKAQRRRSNLVKAVGATYRQYKGLEFWGDVGSEIAAVKGKAPPKFLATVEINTRTLGVNKPQSSSLPPSMLSGSRYCLRTGISTSSVSEKLVVAGNEPLLFLYPRFFSSQFDGSRPKPSTGASIQALGVRRRPKLLSKDNLRYLKREAPSRRSSQLAVSRCCSESENGALPVSPRKKVWGQFSRPTKNTKSHTPRDESDSANVPGEKGLTDSAYDIDGQHTPSACRRLAYTGTRHANDLPIDYKQTTAGPKKTSPWNAFGKRAESLHNGDLVQERYTRGEKEMAMSHEAYALGKEDKSNSQLDSGFKRGDWHGVEPASEYQGNRISVNRKGSTKKVYSRGAFSEQSAESNAAQIEQQEASDLGRAGSGFERSSYEVPNPGNKRPLVQRVIHSKWAPSGSQSSKNVAESKSKGIALKSLRGNQNHNVTERRVNRYNSTSKSKTPECRITSLSTRQRKSIGAASSQLVDSDATNEVPESTESGHKRSHWLRIVDILKHRRNKEPEFDLAEFKQYLQVMTVLLRLMRNTTEYSTEKFECHKVIQLQEHEVVYLTGDDAETSWDIPVVSGCRVHVLPREDDDFGSTRNVLLLGSSKAIKLAEEQLQEELKHTHRPGLPPFAREGDNSKTPLIRSIWAFRRMRTAEGEIERAMRTEGVWINQTWQDARVDDYPMPKVWTVRSFADYVETVTCFFNTKAPQRVVYPNGDIHEIVVRDILFRLFDNPDNRKYFSSRALSLAMSYLHHHRFFDDTRALIPILEEFLTRRSAKRLLQSAASNYNMGFFKLYLEMFEKSKIPPDEYYWIAFLQSIRSNIMRTYFCDLIHNLGAMKKPDVVNYAVNITINHRFRTHLSNGGSGADFVKAMNLKFGDNWVSIAAINKIILETTLASNLDARNDILKFCWEKQLKLDTMTLNNALLYYVESKHIMSGLNFFAKFIKVYRVKMNGLTWQLLWFLGLRRRSYSLCRVIWRYACFLNGTTGGIIKTVRDSLARPLKLDGHLTVGERWIMYLGKIVIGIIPHKPRPSDEHTTDLKELYAETEVDSNEAYPVDPKDATVDHLCTDSKTGPPLEWRVAAADELVEKDLQARRTHKPCIALEEILLRALNRDLFWSKSSKDVHLQREAALPVPIEPKYQSGLTEVEEKMIQEEIEAVFKRSEFEESLSFDDDLDDFPDLQYKLVPSGPE